MRVWAAETYWISSAGPINQPEYGERGSQKKLGAGGEARQLTNSPTGGVKVLAS